MELAKRETHMKDVDQIIAEIEALKALAAEHRHDRLARAALAGQINALEWVLTTDCINLSLTTPGASCDGGSGKPGDR